MRLRLLVSIGGFGDRALELRLAMGVVGGNVPVYAAEAIVQSVAHAGGGVRCDVI